MKPTISMLLLAAGCTFSCGSSLSNAQAIPATGKSHDGSLNTAQTSATADPKFDEVADRALTAMRKRADAMKVGGVALVAYFEGDKVESWSSKMVVVGRMKDLPTDTKKGSNLLAIVYAKAAEMADTLKNSGSQVRPPMTGEFGWEGGLIVHVKNGYLIAAFSGGQSADDVAISHAGLEEMAPEPK